eukprot:TRINITY_DN35562_c0_g3_i1.p1 TRINITY_DN35562_c0_g3~~TRINITY_DN35562_c0_g3_i1.p1  ORF type:complete len:942 (-),score=299.69 TRINITY_DN35562_c0_g3_i1:227-2887(-)
MSTSGSSELVSQLGRMGSPASSVQRRRAFPSRVLQPAEPMNPEASPRRGSWMSSRLEEHLLGQRVAALGTPKGKSQLPAALPQSPAVSSSAPAFPPAARDPTPTPQRSDLYQKAIARCKQVNWLAALEHYSDTEVSEDDNEDLPAECAAHGRRSKLKDQRQRRQDLQQDAAADMQPACQELESDRGSEIAEEDDDEPYDLEAELEALESEELDSEELEGEALDGEDDEVDDGEAAAQAAASPCREEDATGEEDEQEKALEENGALEPDEAEEEEEEAEDDDGDEDYVDEQEGQEEEELQEEEDADGDYDVDEQEAEEEAADENIHDDFPEALDVEEVDVTVDADSVDVHHLERTADNNSQEEFDDDDSADEDFEVSTPQKPPPLSRRRPAAKKSSGARSTPAAPPAAATTPRRAAAAAAPPPRPGTRRSARFTMATDRPQEEAAAPKGFLGFLASQKGRQQASSSSCSPKQLGRPPVAAAAAAEAGAIEPEESVVAPPAVSPAASFRRARTKPPLTKASAAATASNAPPISAAPQGAQGAVQKGARKLAAVPQDTTPKTASAGALTARRLEEATPPKQPLPTRVTRHSLRAMRDDAEPAKDLAQAAAKAEAARGAGRGQDRGGIIPARKEGKAQGVKAAAVEEAILIPDEELPLGGSNPEVARRRRAFVMQTLSSSRGGRRRGQLKPLPAELGAQVPPAKKRRLATRKVPEQSAEEDDEDELWIPEAQPEAAPPKGRGRSRKALEKAACEAIAQAPCEAPAAAAKKAAAKPAPAASMSKEGVKAAAAKRPAAPAPPAPARLRFEQFASSLLKRPRFDSIGVVGLLARASQEPSATPSHVPATIAAASETATQPKALGGHRHCLTGLPSEERLELAEQIERRFAARA